MRPTIWRPTLGLPRPQTPSRPSLLPTSAPAPRATARALCARPRRCAGYPSRAASRAGGRCEAARRAGLGGRLVPRASGMRFAFTHCTVPAVLSRCTVIAVNHCAVLTVLKLPPFAAHHCNQFNAVSAVPPLRPITRRLLMPAAVCRAQCLIAHTAGDAATAAQHGFAQGVCRGGQVPVQGGLLSAGRTGRQAWRLKSLLCPFEGFALHLLRSCKRRRAKLGGGWVGPVMEGPPT